jgi:hypothetical protein
MIEDVTRLPKWAQERIRILEMRLAEVRAENDKLKTFDGSGRIFIQGWPGAKNYPLPEHNRIGFMVGEQKVTVGFSNHGELEVNSAHCSVAILPRAANSFIIEVGP